jgi:hypothetical protein
MSNFLAIATVTATLRRLLEREIGIEVPGITVTTQPPDTVPAPTPDGLNIFMYQVTLNNGYANLDLPRLDPEGNLVGASLTGLNLHFLLTAYGAGNNELQAQKIIGSAIRILSENPAITREAINITKSTEPGFADSDLSDQKEIVKITPQPLSLDEITKLWSSFFQTHYRISVAYIATVVLLDSKKKKAKHALPVRQQAIYVLPFKSPLIETIEPLIVEWTPNASISIRGKNLKNNEVTVQFGDISIEPTPENVADESISVAIPATLEAGIKPVRIVHMLRLGSRPDPYKTFQSNVATFILAPRIINILTPSVHVNSDLRIEVRPEVSPGQKVEFLLGDYSILAQPISGNIPVNKLSVKVPADILEQGQQQAQFLLRIRVDGAESFLQIDNQNRYVGPTVEVVAP